MSEINLQKGLQAYWTMDDADVDGQRNQIRDRSGQGRHLNLSGGVTTGVPSPVGQAIDCDGTDDLAENDTGLISDGQKQATWVLGVKADAAIDDFYGCAGPAGFDFRAKGLGNGQYHLFADMTDDGGTRTTLYPTDANDDNVTLEVGEYYTVAMTFNDGLLRAFAWANGERGFDKSTDPTSGIQANNRTTFYGDTAGAFNYNFGAFWGRELSMPELESMQRMTARQVMRI